jgi:hypothetical protein
LKHFYHTAGGFARPFAYASGVRGFRRSAGPAHALSRTATHPLNYARV